MLKSIQEKLLFIMNEYFSMDIDEKLEFLMYLKADGRREFKPIISQIEVDLQLLF